MSDFESNNQIPPPDPLQTSLFDPSSQSVQEKAPNTYVDEDNDTLQSLADLPADVLAEAMKQLNNPNKPLLADEVVTTATTTSTTTTGAATAAVVKNSWENHEDVKVNPTTQKNSKSVICPFCLKSLVLLPNAATYISKEIFLPYPNAKTEQDGAKCNHFWKVISKMDFENIEVKRALPGQPFRYLTCGDCGSGPLGVTFDSDSNKVFYVSHDRTRYSDKK